MNPRIQKKDDGNTVPLPVRDFKALNRKTYLHYYRLALYQVTRIKYN